MKADHEQPVTSRQVERFITVTLFAIGIASILFVPSRYAKFYLPDHNYINKLFVLIAIVVLLSPLLYVARLLRGTRTIRVGAFVAAFFLVLRCAIDMIEKIDAFRLWPMFGTLTTFEELLRQLSLWIGATFLLGTFYLSIFELIKARLRAESVCRELAEEVVRRTAAGEELQQKSLEERQFSERLAELHRLNLRLSGARTLDELCRLAVEQGRERLGFKRMAIWFLSANRDALAGTFRADDAGNVLDERGRAVPLRDVADYWREVLAGGVDSQVVHSADMEVESRDRHEEEALVLAELRNGDQLLGIIEAHITDPEGLEIKGQQRLLVLFAGTVADLCRRIREDAERERLLSALEQSGESVLITDITGNIQYVNPAFERTSGYMRNEVIGRNARMLRSGNQDVEFYQALWKTIADGKTWQGRLVNKRKDGTLYTEEMNIAPVWDGQGQIVNYVGVKSDITARLALETQYQQAQRMEAIGRLAGGVAHDFNNMLSVILGQTELALERVGPSERLHADLKTIQEAGKRSAELTRQLLAFARRQVVTPRILDLNQEISKMLDLLRRLITENLELSWLPATGLWTIKMDPSQIDQILTNLCVNARDAIAGAGKIIIETANITLDDAYCACHLGCLPGDYVLLAVSDSGCGMDREMQAKIFEPFYTTKGMSEGTGLGLATVYGVIAQNKGQIHVYSEPGLGTTFKMYLPRYAGQTATVRESHGDTHTSANRETILLVEDEPSLLTLCKSMLERLGYHVLAAATPGDALRLAKESEKDVHLVLTDVIMPEMNGRELADSLIALHPNLRRIFMSGYTASVIAQHGVLEDGVPFVQKPFTLRELGAKIREVLNSPAPADAQG